MVNTKIIAIASHKGGVGKTTTAATLGSLLSSQGKKTLLVDLDAQRNLTSTFMGTKFNPEMTLYESMSRKAPLAIYEVRDYLDIVPSSLDMGDLDTVIASRIQRETILRDILRSLKDEYDWILLDCP